MKDSLLPLPPFPSESCGFTHPLTAAAPPPVEKPCTMCKRPYPHTAEYYEKDSSKKSGLRPQCKKCRKDYRAKNKIKRVEYHTKWLEDNPDYMREYRKTYERDRTKDLLYNKKWRDSHRDIARTHSHKRRSIEAAALGSHTVEEMRRQYSIQRGCCWWCQKPIWWEDRHEDHRIPLSKGGSNYANNIVISCAFCNLSKRDKFPYEWCGRLL